MLKKIIVRTIAGALAAAGGVMLTCAIFIEGMNSPVPTWAIFLSALVSGIFMSYATMDYGEPEDPRIRQFQRLLNVANDFDIGDYSVFLHVDGGWSVLLNEFHENYPTRDAAIARAIELMGDRMEWRTEPRK